MGICIPCPKPPIPVIPPERGWNDIEDTRHPIRDSRNRNENPEFNEKYNQETHKEAKTAKISKKTKDEKDISLILNALKNHYLFSTIDKESQINILDKVEFYEIDAKETVFEQGQPGECFFVISSGRLEVKTNDSRAILGPGESFGEYALLDKTICRTATIKTLEASKLWGLNRIPFFKALKKIAKKEYKENKTFIDSVSLFSLLTPVQKEAILSACVTERRSAGEIIVKEGDIGNMFFILKEGFAICNPERYDSREIHKGDYFGEHALIYNLPRIATVIAATEVKLISIGREKLLEALGKNLEDILYRNSQRIALERSTTLKSLSVNQRESILDNTNIKKYHEGEIVIQKGLVKSSKLVILIKGKIKSRVFNKNIEPLDCIGDDHLMTKTQEPYDEDYISIGESDVAEISIGDLERSIGGAISEVTIQNDASSILKQVQLLRSLSIDRMNELSQNLKISNYEDHQLIVRQHDPGHLFFIVKSGIAKVYKNGKFIRDITKNDYFGERSVIFNDFRTATVVADGNVSCWLIEREQFMNIITENIREKIMQRIQLQDSSILLEELIPIKIIGTGPFGNVILTVHKESRMLYALKSITKATIEKYKIHNMILVERNILMQLDHIMITKLIKTFKDKNRLYLLLEYVRGKDIFDALLENYQFNELQSKFYAACLIVTLEYIHERGIIHRDLKPENIMIDQDGYIKLIDFGASAIVEGRTYTAIGTPHYLAPEIILRKGYSFGVDWWSLGVLLFEMIYGYVPFEDDENDPLKIYEKILEHRIEFNRLPYKSTHVRDLLIKLLNKNPAARTCGGFAHLKTNEWFSNFSWDRLMSRSLRAPYIPKCNSLNEEIEQTLQSPSDLSGFLDEREKSQGTQFYRQRTIKENPSSTWDETF